MSNSSGWSIYKGTDDYGFAALLGGGVNAVGDGNFINADRQGYWWSSTEYLAYYAWRRTMGYDGEDVRRSNHDKPYLLSVRCVQD